MPSRTETLIMPATESRLSSAREMEKHASTQRRKATIRQHLATFNNARTLVSGLRTLAPRLRNASVSALVHAGNIDSRDVTLSKPRVCATRSGPHVAYLRRLPVLDAANGFAATEEVFRAADDVHSGARSINLSWGSGVGKPRAYISGSSVRWPTLGIGERGTVRAKECALSATWT